MLFEGPLEAAGSERPASWFGDQAPTLFWPQDHAWCVASEIDLFCTLVAGSNELADRLTPNTTVPVSNPRPSMRAAIYTRVSTRGTSKYGDKTAFDQNPEVQEAPLRAFIASRG
jgi:hypothetical protein